MSTPIGANRPLETIVIDMEIPEETASRLRAEFPQVEFIVPSEGEGSGRQDNRQAEPAAPSADDLRRADGLICWGLAGETLDAAPRLRWLHAAGAGVEGYDLRAIAARGIVMTNSSGVSAPNIAEHVVGMMTALARRIPRLVRAQAERVWRDTETHAEVAELQGQTALIVGTGEIGQEVARRLAAFGMQVHGFRRRADLPAPGGFDRIFAGGALHEGLGSADHVIVTLPHTPDSRGLFDAAAIAAMKRGAIIYNVGRGAVIDTAALVAALQEGHLGGAGLDVTDPEPLPAESPLWEMDTVLLTAHTSGATPRYWERQGALIAENIRRIQRGEQPRNVVDLESGY